MGRDKRLERPLVLQHLRLKVETYFTRHLSRCKIDDDEIDLVVKVMEMYGVQFQTQSPNLIKIKDRSKKTKEHFGPRARAIKGLRLVLVKTQKLKSILEVHP